jgi:Domain of unknown function (DUF6438)/Ankyrin repeats (3 copies)
MAIFSLRRSRALGVAVLVVAIFAGGAAFGLHWQVIAGRLSTLVPHRTNSPAAPTPEIVTVADLDDGGRSHWVPLGATIHVPGSSPTWHERVDVSVVVTPDGSVVSADAASGPAQYRAQAMKLALGWHFIPFERGGRKIYARVTAWVDVVPNERRPDYRMPFPPVRDWNSLKITFERGACFGDCPSYKLVVHGDGVVDYHGESSVAIRGDHHAKLPRATVEQLVARFRKAEFFWLLDSYNWGGADNPTQVISIAFDGRFKQVYDSNGEWVGLPAAVRELEDQIDQLVGVERWTKSNSETGPSLVAEGWDFHSKSCANRSMVAGTVRLGTSQALRDLLADGAPVGKTCNETSGGFAYEAEPEIETAARRGDEEMVVALLSTSAFHDAAVLRRAFVEAAEAGNLAVIKAMRGGMAIESDGFKSEPGDAALRAGAGSCNPDVVQYILDTTTIADINGADEEGDTAVLKAASTADDEEKLRSGVRCDRTIQVLVKAGASVKVHGKNNRSTALHYAQMSPEVTRVLIAAGADVNARDSSGETPIMDSWDPRVTRLLLEAGADPTLKRDDGRTALDMVDNTRPGSVASGKAIRAWMAAHPKTSSRH